MQWKLLQFFPESLWTAEALCSWRDTDTANVEVSTGNSQGDMVYPILKTSGCFSKNK